MARDISFMHYLRAHGNTPGPTQRPILTGTVSGLVAGIPYVLLLYASGALESAASGFRVGMRLALFVAVVLSVLGGILYAVVFKLAANDRRGGWLFGMSFGFLLWILGPVAVWQTITGKPVATGIAAIGIFGGQVLSGLVLGLIFPWIHFLFRGRLRDVADTKAGKTTGESEGMERHEPG